MATTPNWTWEAGSWPEMVKAGVLKDLGEVRLDDIASPWSHNIHCHPNYDRLFWSMWRDGMKTPFLLRPWSYPPKAIKKPMCRADGSRMDLMPAPTYKEIPTYELVIGNMRYCASYVLGNITAPSLLLPESEWNLNIEEIWEIYHPVFEGNWYTDPNNGIPSKASGTYIKK